MQKRTGHTPERQYVFADLFSGPGGLSQGFTAAGFRSVAAVEFDRWAAATYRANFGDHVLCAPIEHVKVRALPGGRMRWSAPVEDGRDDVLETPAVDVVIGGPPCQGFSPLGRMMEWDRSDPRNGLWQEYVRLVAELRPAAFVMENVPELLKSQDFVALKKEAEKLGYTVISDVLNAAHFEVPQRRRRAIVIASRVGPPFMPQASLTARTVRDAIGHVPLNPAGHDIPPPPQPIRVRDLHFGRRPTPTSLERYRVVPPGGNRFDLLRNRPDIAPRCWRRKKTGSTDVFGRLEWDRPCSTIRTEFFKPEKGRYLHPAADRPITHREAALLQTFPEDFLFVGSKIEIAKQIGNAVPCRLAYFIALALADHLRLALRRNTAQETRRSAPSRPLELFAP